jgi:HEPN domain-containing protein
MIKYTLLENAIDSIENGIEQLEKAVKTSEKKYYKYSILNLFQGAELLLKEILVQKNRIIIFDKNSLFKKCVDPLNPKIEELYNCKSIDINEICSELKKHYPSKFDNISRKVIENMSRERNKIQHFAIDIDSTTIKTSLIKLYGKVIKPCFEILNDGLICTSSN